MIGDRNTHPPLHPIEVGGTYRRRDGEVGKVVKEGGLTLFRYNVGGFSMVNIDTGTSPAAVKNPCYDLIERIDNILPRPTGHFKRDAHGFIVVNLSRGPSKNPVIHEFQHSAEAEARRLAQASPNQTFQVFEVVPKLGTYRYEQKKVTRYFNLYRDSRCGVMTYGRTYGTYGIARRAASDCHGDMPENYINTLSFTDTIEGWKNG